MNGEPITVIDGRDIRFLRATADAIGVDEAAGEALHLQVGPNGRRWVIDNPLGRAELRIPADGVTMQELELSGDDHTWYPISDRIRRFAELVRDDEISLVLADGRTVVAVAEGVSAAIDLVDRDGRPPTAFQVRRKARAVVTAWQWCTALWSARSLPTGIGEVSYPMPPMWMQLADGEVVLHVDWSDFLPSRSTYRTTAVHHEASATAAIPHVKLASFLGETDTFAVPDSDEQIAIDIGEAFDGDGESLGDVVTMSSGAGWRITMSAEHPLRARWETRLEAELADDGLEIQSSSGAEWVVLGGDASLPAAQRPRVHVTLHHGHPDIARVSTALTTGVVESLDLLRELSSLNAASTGVRYWLEDETVYAAADVRCSALSTLPSTIRTVADSVHTYGQVLASLGA